MLKYKKREAKEWTKEHLAGDIAAHVTVFDENGDVDLEAMRYNFRRGFEFGADGITVNGVAGEHSSLTMEEKKNILELAVEEGARVTDAEALAEIDVLVEFFRDPDRIGPELERIGRLHVTQ